MDVKEIERRLLALDEQIHEILRYISKSKRLETEAEIEDYEGLKNKIAEALKEPLDPTAEIRRMRERRYMV